jgi:hypothetical protein
VRIQHSREQIGGHFSLHYCARRRATGYGIHRCLAHASTASNVDAVIQPAMKPAAVASVQSGMIRSAAEACERSAGA